VVSYYYDAWGNFATKFFFKYGLANAKNPYTVTLNGTTYTAQDIDNLNGSITVVTTSIKRQTSIT
jgi:hypothetical protein